VAVDRQRIYYNGKCLTGLETFDFYSQSNAFILLRLPRISIPEDREIFEAGDLIRGRVNTEFLRTLFENEGRLSVAQAEAIITRANALIELEPSLLEVKEPCAIIGDIHGQWFDLAAVLHAAGGLHSDSSFVFLGDYVDRGLFSSEVILYLFALKINAPQRFTLLRGNHESISQMLKQSTALEFQIK
jgi:serine/threonine-protein phosphatase 2B catalytic subunit